MLSCFFSFSLFFLYTSSFAACVTIHSTLRISSVNKLSPIDPGRVLLSDYRAVQNFGSLSSNLIWVQILDDSIVFDYTKIFELLELKNNHNFDLTFGLCYYSCARVFLSVCDYIDKITSHNWLKFKELCCVIKFL